MLWPWLLLVWLLAAVLLLMLGRREHVDLATGRTMRGLDRPLRFWGLSLLTLALLGHALGVIWLFLQGDDRSRILAQLMSPPMLTLLVFAGLLVPLRIGRIGRARRRQHPLDFLVALRRARRLLHRLLCFAGVGLH